MYDAEKLNEWLFFFFFPEGPQDLVHSKATSGWINA